MLRSLIRSGLVVLLVLSLSVPARALPLAGERLAGEREGLTSWSFSFSELWESLVSPIVALWTGGTCGGSTGQSSGVCDPNG